MTLPPETGGHGHRKKIGHSPKNPTPCPCSNGLIFIRVMVPWFCREGKQATESSGRWGRANDSRPMLHQPEELVLELLIGGGAISFDYAQDRQDMHHRQGRRRSAPAELASVGAHARDSPARWCAPMAASQENLSTP